MTSGTNRRRHDKVAVVLVAATCLLLILLALRALTDNPLPLVIVLAVALVILVLRGPLADAANGVWLRRSLLRSSSYVRLEGPQDIEGHVTRVGLRTTTLRTPTGDQIRVPNTVLANSILTTFEDGSQRANERGGRRE